MVLKVKHEELNKVKDVMMKDGELLDTEIENMLGQIAKLETIWQGQDSDLFCMNVSDYVTRMKSISGSMKLLSEFIGKADNKYIESDNSFSRELTAEVSEYYE